MLLPGLCFAAAGTLSSGLAGATVRAIEQADPPAGEAKGRPDAQVPTGAVPQKVTMPDNDVPLGEAEEFLKTARVDGVRVLSTGITRPLQLTLYLDGITRRAVFRHVNEYRPRADTSEGIRLDYRDSAIFEVAAYRLARLLHVDHVPPTVIRKFREEDFLEGANILDFPEREGSLQLWVEDSMTEKRRRTDSLTSPYGLFWVRQFHEMWLFDALIFNEDRNQGNILIDADWKLWFIDATRSFRPFRQLRDPERILICRRTTWERLRKVTDDELEVAMEGLLSGGEIRGLLERRRALVEYLGGLIEKRGEGSVLFDYTPRPAQPFSSGSGEIAGPSGL